MVGGERLMKNSTDSMASSGLIFNYSHPNETEFFFSSLETFETVMMMGRREVRLMFNGANAFTLASQLNEPDSDYSSRSCLLRLNFVAFPTKRKKTSTGCFDDKKEASLLMDFECSFGGDDDEKLFLFNGHVDLCA